MTERLVVVSQRETNRFSIIKETLDRNLTVGEAARQLNLSTRQIYRLKREVSKKGLEGVAHKNRGKNPSNKKSKELLDKIAQLYEEKYKGFNMVHFTEKLEELEGIYISRETVRKHLLTQGLIKPKKKRPKHRSRRERMPKVGMMIQMDTSEHNWLLSRGEELKLIAAIDDANSEVVAASFEEKDGTLSNMALMKKIIKSKGIPLSFYVDAAGHFKVTKKTSPFRNCKADLPPTQIERALDELGVNLIIAGSPQAKGRIERLFETFQDRLLNEMTLHNITTKHEANDFLGEFLPRFNEKFMVLPRLDKSAYLPLPAYVDLDTIFCIKHERMVKADNTVSYQGRLFQILPSKTRLSFSKAKVMVHECIDGSVHIFYNNEELAITELKVAHRTAAIKSLTLEDFMTAVKDRDTVGVT
jgi:transposase